jgi:hypothetical protein
MSYEEVKDTMRVLASLPIEDKQAMPHIQLDKVDYFAPIPDEQIRNLVEEQVATLPIFYEDQIVQFKDFSDNTDMWLQFFV